MYYFLFTIVWLITWLPLRILYLLSDLSYFILYYIVKYRKEIVRLNLLNSFPNKSENERLAIERRFYRFFCDLFVETIYEMHLSKAEITRRMTYGNVQGILDQYDMGKSVMIMTSHYGNWEWTLAFSQFLPAESPANPIYKKLSNQKFDKFIYQLRSKFGAKLIEKKDLLKTMFKLKKENQLGNYWMISDQTPNFNSVHYWTKFLNQDTATLIGTEQLARKFDYPVFYADISMKKRGYYHCEYIPISLHPNQTVEFEITEKYMRMLEKTIQEKPEFWLWTHRRWKVTK